MKKVKSLPEMNTIGANIKEARQQAKLSQQLLSERLELLGIYICRGSISRIERGKRAVTDIEIDGIAKILNVSPNELFQWPGN